MAVAIARSHHNKTSFSMFTRDDDSAVCATIVLTFPSYRDFKSSKHTILQCYVDMLLRENVLKDPARYYVTNPVPSLGQWLEHWILHRRLHDRIDQRVTSMVARLHNFYKSRRRNQTVFRHLFASLFYRDRESVRSMGIDECSNAS